MAKFNSYKGRRRGGKVFGIIVALLLIAVVAVLVLAATQQIVFTPDGPKLSSRYSPTPKPSPSAPVEETTPSAEPSFIIEEPSATPELTPEPTPTPTSPKPEKLTAVMLDPRDDVALAGAKQLGRDGLINAVVLDMCDEYGTLYWQSSTASSYGTAAHGAVAQGALFSVDEIAALKDEGLYVIAQITAFRESYLWFVAPQTAVRWASGTRWLDRDRHGWIDPYNEDGRQYITSLAQELIDAGADEVMLRNFCFPDNGQVDVISYSYEQTALPDRAGTLERYRDELSETLEALGGELSVVTDLSFAAIASPYTEPAAADEIRAALASGGDVILTSSNGRYPASW